MSGSVSSGNRGVFKPPTPKAMNMQNQNQTQNQNQKTPQFFGEYLKKRVREEVGMEGDEFE